jgi:hypothetical protein
MYTSIIFKETLEELELKLEELELNTTTGVGLVGVDPAEPPPQAESKKITAALNNNWKLVRALRGGKRIFIFSYPM